MPQTLLQDERASTTLGRAALTRSWLLLAALVLAGGCSSLARRPQADQVVAARELTRQGLEAQQNGSREKAAELFAQAIEVCPVDERCRRHYAEALWRQGRRPEAIEQMEEAVRLSGGDPLALVRLGEMHLALGDEQNALKAAEAAIAQRIDLAPGWALRGSVFQRRGEGNEALACYHRALRYQPRDPQVQLAVAEIQRDLGRPQRALAVLDAMVEEFLPGQAPPEILRRHGLALKSLGRYEEAVDSLAAAVEQGAGGADALVHLAEARMLAGDAANAQLALRRALEIDPRHAAARRLEIALNQRQPVALTRGLR